MTKPTTTPAKPADKLLTREGLMATVAQLQTLVDAHTDSLKMRDETITMLRADVTRGLTLAGDLQRQVRDKDDALKAMKETRAWQEAELARLRGYIERVDSDDCAADGPVETGGRPQRKRPPAPHEMRSEHLPHPRDAFGLATAIGERPRHWTSF